MTIASAPSRRAAPSTNSSLRTLLPASPTGPASSRLIHTSAPIAAPKRGRRCSGVGRAASGSRGSRAQGADMGGGFGRARARPPGGGGPATPPPPPPPHPPPGGGRGAPPPPP